MLEDITASEIKDQLKTNKTVRLITIAVGALLIGIVGFILYKKFIKEPKELKAKEQFHIGLNYAAQDSVDLAIKETQFFVNKYDGTKGGENAQFTLARMLMEKGKFKEALNELEGVDFDDTFGKVFVLGLQGDCYSEMKNLDKALTYYLKASSTNPNEKTTPEYLFKAGLVAEALNDLTKAEELYLEIKNNYNQFSSQKTIDKYIMRVTRN
jgi:TolA-binding protein